MSRVRCTGLRVGWRCRSSLAMLQRKAPRLIESGAFCLRSGDYSFQSLSFFSAGMGSDLARGFVMSSR